MDLLGELEEKKLATSEFVIFLLFVGLLLGIIIKLLTKKLHIPYTPFLTLAGVVLGALDRELIEHDQAMEAEEL